MSLTARLLETAGIATVIAGSARDIVEHAGAPRFAFTDFPLGNPCGKPYDTAMQLRVVEFALGLLTTATEPNVTRRAPFEWSADQSWRAVYGRVGADNRAALLAQGDERRRQQAARRGAS